MALDGTYSGLQASIADWIHRDDMTTVITSDLIVLAEERIARDLRLANQVESATITTTASVQYVAAPTGFLEMVSIVAPGDPQYPLQFLSVEKLQEWYPSTTTGKPVAYSLDGSRILFGKTPDAVYAFSARYYKRFAALSVTSTNWLLQNHPSVYLFAALAESDAYLLNDPRVQLWDARYRDAAARLQASDKAGQYSGSALIMRG